LSKFKYVTAYIAALEEILRTAEKSSGIAKTFTAQAARIPQHTLTNRMYYLLYQRLNDFGGFEWHTNIFGTKPNQ
jgi:hypothetical protein